MYLGIDIGTSAVKTALVDERAIFRLSKRYPTSAKWGEQSPRIVEDTLRDITREISSKLGNDFRRLRGICLTGHGPSIILVDNSGTPKSQIITWQDTRARKQEEAIAIYYPGFNRGGSSFEGKLMWLMDNHPELFDKPCTALYPKDFLLRRLGGEAVMDRSTASTIVWYDQENNSWIESQNVPSTTFLPRVVDSWQQIGITDGEFCVSCNLPAGVPLYAGGIDAYCETLGVGAIATGNLVDGSGTSTCISICLDNHERGDLHVIPNRRIKMETMSSTGSAIDWYLRLIGEDTNFFHQLYANSLSHILFLPYLNGERSPIWDERASGALIGLNSSSDRMEVAYAVLQGCAFGIRQNIERLESLSKKPGEEIIAAGGGAKNDVWMTIKANVTRKRYLRPEDIDASALGAAMIAALGRDEIQPDDACRRWVRIERVFEPNDDHVMRHQYDVLYSLFVDLYPRLQDIYWKLYDIKESTWRKVDEKAGPNN